MVDDYEFYEEDEEYEQVVPDEYFRAAQQDIREIYGNNLESVYYLRQLQVKLEKKYFHWVTNNALVGLVKMGYLHDIRLERDSGTSTRYFIHHSNRYPKRDIKKIEEIITEYSQDHITRSCGSRAEDLFCNALALHKYEPIARKVKEHNGKKWEKSGHDLDYMFYKDNIFYGCEIKNTLGYIEKDELDIKLEMCGYLGVKPLFIMRFAPKTYNKLINEFGGYSMIFETQIYELSQIELVEKIKQNLGLPVICSRYIPDGIIERFEKWHNKTCKK
jgi:hypothetical protein